MLFVDRCDFFLLYESTCGFLQVEKARQAVKSTPDNHPNLASMLDTLSSHLVRRYERIENTDDLEEAIEKAWQAVESTPDDHPDLARWLSNLARAYLLSSSPLHRLLELSYLLKSWDYYNSPPLVRMQSAQSVASLFASRSDWERSSKLLQRVIELLLIVSSRSLQRSDMQHILQGFSGLACMAAATALNAGKTEHGALKLLELGRGVIAGLSLEMRTDVSALQEQYPGLAAEFGRLRDELDSSANAANSLISIHIAPSSSSQTRGRGDVGPELEKVIKKIRAKPEFENFLHPPTEQELMVVAHFGPIVCCVELDRQQA